MPNSNPRKRQAPGPPMSSAQQKYTPSQIQNADYSRWGQDSDNQGYTDQTNLHIGSHNYDGVPISQSFEPPMPNLAAPPSTQLARRPLNNARQLVPTGQRGAYDQNSDPWGQFGDVSMMDPQNPDGTLEDYDNIEVLEGKAVVAKRDATAKRKQIPPFVQKLSSFLDDGKNTELIRWSDRGDSFVVLDEDEFAKTLIPELFKHNNYASFVRQLNMYGFHKRVGLSDNSMKASERKNKSPSEYYNPYFKRGHPNLLWLINKPRGGTGKKGGKIPRPRHVRDEQPQQDRDSADDDMDVEEVPNYPQQQYQHTLPASSRAISAAPESGPLQRREMAVVQKDIAEIQKTQGNINQAINRLRREHNQLFQQAMTFKSLHDRHESSINAILTFLATVYNRSLDGQAVPQDIVNIFANAIPNGIPNSQQQHQGSVVDMEDMPNRPQQAPAAVSPYRRQQRLLMGPEQNNGRDQTAFAASAPQPRYPQKPQASSIEELADTPEAVIQTDQEKDIPRQDLMDLINNTNAMTNNDPKAMEFPQVLSHFENANGNSPLTHQQRSEMLSMIASQTTAPGSNNALVSPTPPPAPSLEKFEYQNAELDKILALQQDQDYKIDGLKQSVPLLSPSPELPNLDSGFFAADNTNPDLNQYFDSDAFYDGNSSLGGQPDYSTFNYGDPVLGESHFDLGMDGATDRIESIETHPGEAIHTNLGDGRGLSCPSSRGHCEVFEEFTDENDENDEDNKDNEDRKDDEIEEV
ncbi:hypothetical protein BJ878DRAFT_536211 [Calycina marina]|uniref:HSF-type DNA-binding domain-containing protein n=1 Tax=Calycina marina TaxID=1763456 RepID=A0A9P8CE39_9HELO|nr:hypothetical protein BJ878DRAFT_536211 [Calycina marina]